MSENSNTKKRGFLQGVIDLFASVYLTLVMLGLIAFFSLLGVTGQIQGVYHTKYFRVLLGILFINLLICTLQRLPQAYRRMRQDGRDRALPPPRKADFSLRVDSENPEVVLLKAEQIAFGKGANVKRRRMPWPRGKGVPDAAENSLISFHSRGRWSLLGPYVTHLGILLILVGGIIGSLYSLSAGVLLRPGEATRTARMDNNVQVRLGFTIQCNDFQIERYEDRQPSDYISELSIIDEGRTVKEKRIEVNKPLHYGGFGIYQSSYEKDHSFRLMARPVQDGNTLEKNVDLREPWTLSGTSVSFMVVDYQSSSRGMGRDMGPRAIVIKFEGQEAASQLSLFEKYPDFDAQREGDYIVSFKRMSSGYRTGLRLMKDPGTPVIWAGSIILILGVLQSFIVKHRRAWLISRKVDGEVELSLVARTRKARSMLLSWEENIILKLRNELNARPVENQEGYFR
ncbi:MAG: cytochrome c biogenesis protein ResB [bacterium]